MPTEQKWKENAHKIKGYLLPGWQEAVQNPTQSYEPNNSVFVQKSKTSKKYEGAIVGVIVGTACVALTLPLLLLKNQVLELVKNSLNIAIPVIILSSLALITLSAVIGSILNHLEEKNGVVKIEPLDNKNGIQYKI